MGAEHDDEQTELDLVGRSETVELRGRRVVDAEVFGGGGLRSVHGRGLRAS